MKTTSTTFNDLEHREQVVSLWKEVFGYETAHNAPELVINKKTEVEDGLFIVVLNDQNVIGTVMAGYDEHRGWIYSMAVAPHYQNQGIGTILLSFVEKRLSELGCVKINLQII